MHPSPSFLSSASIDQIATVSLEDRMGGGSCDGAVYEEAIKSNKVECESVLEQNCDVKSSPEGFNTLKRKYENVEDPLLHATPMYRYSTTSSDTTNSLTPDPSSIQQQQRMQNIDISHLMQSLLFSPQYITNREVMMEDVVPESSVVNIDIDDDDDDGDELAAVEYVDDLYAYYRSMENCSLISPDYMIQQSDNDESMRALLVDWVIGVHYCFDHQPETVFLSVNLIDRFLSKQSATDDNLQLVGLVAMHLSCKYYERSVPSISILIWYSDDIYSTSEVLDMEKLMLSKLEYDMSEPTAYVFMMRFLKAARSDPKLDHLAFFLIHLCLVDYEMLKFPPSLLAAASVYTAQYTLYGEGQWSQTCEWHTKYSEDELLECSRLIVHHSNAKKKPSAVCRKYKYNEFRYKPRCKPVNFPVRTNHSYNQNDNIT